MFTMQAGPTDSSFVFAPILFFLVLFLVVPLLLALRWRRRALEAGYPGLRVYLRSVPRTDAEKRSAIDMAFTGLFLCVLGVLIKPLVLIGVFPLYYGAKKLCFVWSGLEIPEDDGDLSEQTTQ